jgi:hypothetical protein
MKRNNEGETLILKSPLTPLCQRGEYHKSHFGKGGLRGIFLKKYHSHL